MSVHLLNEASFLDDKITEQDVDNAKVNAQAGDAVAQYHLALMFDAGRGVKHNPKEAEKWYKKAAEQGYADAQYFLGRMYEAETSGIAQNEDEAMRWYNKAAEQGHQGALLKVAN